MLDAEPPCLAQDVPGLVAGGAAGGRGGVGVGQGGELAAGLLQAAHESAAFSASGRGGTR
ncbi:hypothetical protein [Streptomyces sp. NPDC018584]|uniref:hypothetical protein n=1 Tax=unclassified Streptomyces TaxID=2593676 RepID=UPI003796CA4D